MTIDQTQRPRFFEGQYLGSQDLTDALEYARLQAARHCLGGHTWGIAEGLDLREVPSIGEATKVSMVIDPGYAWDGYGRPIVVLEPYKIPEALFDSIKYDAVQDADGKGRMTEIWLRYYEAGTKKPASGFEVCDTANTYRRIQESFVVSIGCKLAHTDDHDPVTVGGKSGDALKALKLFNSKAPAIYDESIPQQTFPEEGERAYWFVPIGYVRWLPAQSGAGHFAALSDYDKQKVRLIRRYIGTVAENIEAAGGAIRLRDRTVNPSKSYFKATDDELVNVEGSARVEGDVNIAGGALNFRHADGTDRDTALRILRTGDSSSSEGGRSLQVGIGPDDQSDNKFSIGPMEIDTSKDPDEYTVDPKVTVVSDGKVGIGTDSPEVLLHAVGDCIRLESEDGKKQIDLRTDEDRVDVDTTTSKLYLHSSGDDTKSLNQVIINPFSDEGEVGIGTESPKEKLHVVGNSILLSSSDDKRKIDLRTSGSAVDVESTTSKIYLHSSGAGGKNQVVINPNNTTEGEVGIGTATPQQKLHVVGKRIRLSSEDGLRIIDLRTDGYAVDLQSDKNKLYLRSSGISPNNQIIMNYHPTKDGNVGIGLENPVCKLHVAKEIAGNEASVANHVAVIENTSASSGGDVLALKIHSTSPDASNNFITFFDGNNNPIGRIEKYIWGLDLVSGGADYAESLPRLDEKENLEAGDVVGIVDGKVTRRTAGAQHVSAITDRPIVVANSPRPDDPRKFEKVSFLGQVNVKVRGPVQAGEYIVPSGANDGLGVAQPAEKISPQQAGQILGQAWESSAKEEPKRVLVAVGLPSSHSAPLAALVQSLSRQVEELKEEVKRYKK
jgi:hypothetical protein